MQTERYSPFYVPNAGVENGKLLSNYEFEMKWDQVFNQNASKIQNFKYTKDDVKMARTFDLLAYRTLVKYVYKKDLQMVDPKNTSHYMDFNDNLFSKPFMNKKKKIKMTASYFEKVDLDIIFLQEIDQDIINEINKKNEFLVKFNNSS